MPYLGDPVLKTTTSGNYHVPKLCAFQPVVNVVHLEQGAQRILFNQDIHGPFHVDFGLDIMQWYHH